MTDRQTCNAILPLNSPTDPSPTRKNPSVDATSPTGIHPTQAPPQHPSSHSQRLACQTRDLFQTSLASLLLYQKYVWDHQYLIHNKAIDYFLALRCVALH